jgi:uncharacterized protein YqjF (DUF2071 family)
MAAIDRLLPRRRPLGASQGSQRWHRLLFSHWEVTAETLRPLVDSRLTLDSFEGRYFVGLVAFEMRAVRPFHWLPTIPTTGEFPEVNLRTYVHLDGKEPGVWFFSLDAQSLLAVIAARLAWHLPYFHTLFSVHEDDADSCVRWQARRLRPRPPAHLEVEFTIEESIPPPGPESFEFFLTERYQFYAARRGQLLRARVHHSPYELRRARVVQLETDLLEKAGILKAGPRTPDFFSPGVDVEVFPQVPATGD